MKHMTTRRSVLGGLAGATTLCPMRVLAQAASGGLLARLHAAAGGLVCSAHRQAVARVGDGLVVEATCVEDGVVEAVRAREEPLLLGVQWHPEFDHRADGRIDGALLLRHFVDAARRDEGAR